MKVPHGIKIPEHLGHDAGIMRLVSRQIAGYKEIRTFWDLNEVMRANELLDIQDDIAWLDSQEMMRKTRKPGRR